MFVLAPRHYPHRRLPCVRTWLGTRLRSPPVAIGGVVANVVRLYATGRPESPSGMCQQLPAIDQRSLFGQEETVTTSAASPESSR